MTVLAQFPIHIAVGLYASDLVKRSQALNYGLILGSFAPDLDFIPLVAVYAFNPTLARSFHRSASHSFLIPLLILVISVVARLITRKQRLMDWGVGLAVGLISHVVLDLVFWFDQVQVLWPLDLWGISTTVDLWKGYTPPTSIYLLIGPAAEFLFYGLLFRLLQMRALRGQDGARFMPSLRLMERLSFAVFAVYVVLVFILAPSTYEEAVYGLTAFLFAPLSLYWLWKSRGLVIEC